jgi:hypothetical protein
VIVQWCCKGISKLDDEEVVDILTGGPGILSNLWQGRGILDTGEAQARLTERSLELHVNNYDGPDPAAKPPSPTKVRDVTPFISLSAGCVDRDVFRETNVLNPARRTALEFATNTGQVPGWIFTCWVIVTLNRATPIEGVAEEVRDLNQGRRYSRYWPEGEIAAKINVPSRQILCVERWEPASPTGGLRRRGGYINKGFAAPRPLLNLRRML